jgi:hypothetical protein
MKFKLEIQGGHLIFKNGEFNVLFDTGSPISIHSTNLLEIFGRKFTVTDNFMGADVKKISKMANAKIDTILGYDILSQYRLRIDYMNRYVSFESLSANYQSEGNDLEFIAGVPIINIEIANRKLKAIFDTGARISYMRDDVLKNYQNNGVEKDFHPIIGEFISTIYQIETQYSNDKFTVTYGSLPSNLKILVKDLGVDSILGYDFLKNFFVDLNLRDRKIIVNKYS